MTVTTTAQSLIIITINEVSYNDPRCGFVFIHEHSGLAGVVFKFALEIDARNVLIKVSSRLCLLSDRWIGETAYPPNV